MTTTSPLDVPRLSCDDGLPDQPGSAPPGDASSTVTPVLRGDLVSVDSGLRLVDRHGASWELPDLPVTVAQTLSLCDGTRTAASLRGRVAAHERATWDSLLDALTRSGLVDLMATSPALDRVILLGAHDIASRVARALVCAQVPVHVVDPLPPDPGVHGRTRHHHAAEALRSSLVREGAPATRVGAGGHWADLCSTTRTDLVIVASPHMATDRAVTDHLLAQHLPHLIVEAHRDHARVGPLVRPGVAGCLGCLDRHHRDVDPGWPSALTGLCRRRARPGTVAATWAAATALAWALASSPPRAGQGPTTTSLRVGEGVPAVQEWPAHPACPCQGHLTS